MVLMDGEDVNCLWGDVETVVFGLGAREDMDPEVLREPEWVTEDGPVKSSPETSGCPGGPVTAFGVLPVPTDGETLLGTAGLVVNIADSDGRDGTSGTGGFGGVDSVGGGSPSGGRSPVVAFEAAG